MLNWPMAGGRPWWAEEMARMFNEGEQVRQSVGGVATDVREDGDQVVLTMDVPGVEPEDLELEVEGRNLVVRGEKRAPELGEGSRVHHRERRFGRFERAFTLGFQVDRDRIDAKVDDGVLTVRLPKAEEAKARRIEVKAS